MDVPNEEADTPAPTSVESGTGGLAANGVPLGVMMIMALGMLLLTGGVIATQRN